MNSLPLSRPPTMGELIEQFAEVRCVGVKDLAGPSRLRSVAWPRQELFAFLRAQKTPSGAPRWSLTRIGRRFNRDHTTVLYGIRQHRKRVAAVEGLRA